MFSLPKAMQRRIALRRHFPHTGGQAVRNAWKSSSRFAQLWECVRVLAPLFDSQAISLAFFIGTFLFHIHVMRTIRVRCLSFFC
jgi:hypothetical protein